MGVVCIYKNFVDANSVIESLKKRVKTLKIRASENTVDDPASSHLTDQPIAEGISNQRDTGAYAGL
jgi:hypothetical protein